VHPAQVIEVPVPAYQPLDVSLTQPLAEPPAPPRNCELLGVSVPCALDGLLNVEAWRGVLQRCNADRATSAEITKPPGDGR
jgi:hypothetical protein